LDHGFSARLVCDAYANFHFVGPGTWLVQEMPVTRGLSLRELKVFPLAPRPKVPNDAREAFEA
jgi:hypothetical protein